MAGWGRYSDHSEITSQKLLHANVSIVSDREAMAHYGRDLHYDSLICADTGDGYGGTCGVSTCWRGRLALPCSYWHSTNI